MNSGIYRIRNRRNGKCYYGSSVNLKARVLEHFASLRLRKHHNIVLQRAWTKYGKSSFVFEVIVILEKEELIPTEQRLLDLGLGEYNVARHSQTSMRGRKHSPETRRKMSETHKKLARVPGYKSVMHGRKHSVEARRKIGKASRERMIGQRHSMETRKKMSESQKKCWARS